jgi:hypothetical protein
VWNMWGTVKTSKIKATSLLTLSPSTLHKPHPPKDQPTHPGPLIETRSEKQGCKNH